MAELPLDQAIPRFKTNEDRVDRFVNGNDAATVMTSTGVAIPSLRKFLADKDTEINTAADGILEQSVAARNLAFDWAEKDLDVEVQPGLFSAKHYALTATSQAGEAEQWANANVGVELEPGLYSGKHWAAQAESWANRNNWVVDGPFLGTGAETDYPLAQDPGSSYNMIVIAGGVGQMVSTASYSLIYVAGDPFIRITLPDGVPFEVRSGGSIAVGTPADGSVALQKIQNIEALRLLGRTGVSPGGVQELTPAQIRDFFMPTGSVVDSMMLSYTAFSAYNSPASVIAFGSRPTITEGIQLVSGQITPKSSTNKLRIQIVSGTARMNAFGGFTWGIFNGQSDAIYTAGSIPEQGSPENSPMKLTGGVEYTPGNTLPQTISLRVGSSAGLQFALNAYWNGGGLGGGVDAVRLLIEEIKG